MKTTTFERVNTTSGRTLKPSSEIRKSLRNLNPFRWSADRTSTSGRVPDLRLPFPTLLAAGEVGDGYGARWPPPREIDLFP